MSDIQRAFQAAGRTAGTFGGGAYDAPSSRYILPQFEERTAYGFKRQDPYAKLFEDRIIFLGVQIDDASADDGREPVEDLVHGGAQRAREIHHARLVTFDRYVSPGGRPTR